MSIMYASSEQRKNSLVSYIWVKIGWVTFCIKARYRTKFDPLLIVPIEQRNCKVYGWRWKTIYQPVSEMKSFSRQVGWKSTSRHVWLNSGPPFLRSKYWPLRWFLECRWTTIEKITQRMKMIQNIARQKFSCIVSAQRSNSYFLHCEND